MGVVLTDVLLELSDPVNLTRFRRDPDAFLQGKSLSEIEEEALRSGSLQALFKSARSIDGGGGDQQFNKVRHSEVGLSITPDIGLVLTHNDQIAIGTEGQVYVDSEGRLYIAQARNT